MANSTSPTNFIDLNGKVFGELLVTERAGSNKKGEALWNCLCNCGKNKIIDGCSLRAGRTKSCGCLQLKAFKENRKKRKFNITTDLTGQRFEKLIVIKKVENKKETRTMWECLCDCGNTHIVAAKSLKNGFCKSCGCGMGKSLEKGKSAFNTLFRVYQKNAKTKKLIFNLSETLFKKLTQENCFYCGSEPKNVMKNWCDNGDYIYNGIDRIDNTVGYEESNCVPCCKQCNYAKRKISQQEFLLWVERVYNHSIKTAP
jgi:hypothetical protein